MSKKMSYLLRHGALNEGLAMTPDGFVSFPDMIKKTGLKAEQINEVVKTDNKQRYAVKDINGVPHIRANQGHSIAVQVELKKVIEANEIPVVIHGTYFKPWAIIKNEGLSRMNRNHIHFASGFVGQDHVISGMRSSAQVLVHIDAEKAMQDGIEFFISANGVILTAGDEKGFLLPKYFLKVESSKGERLEF